MSEKKHPTQRDAVRWHETVQGALDDLVRREDDEIGAARLRRFYPEGRPRTTEYLLGEHIGVRLGGDGIAGLRFSTFFNGREWGIVHSAGEHLVAVFTHRISGEWMLNARRVDDAIAEGCFSSPLWPYHPDAPFFDGLAFASTHADDATALHHATRELLRAGLAAPSGTDVPELVEIVKRRAVGADARVWED